MEKVRLVTRDGVNMIRCPAKKCQGLGIVTLTLDDLAEIATTLSKKYTRKFNCNHLVSIDFTATNWIELLDEGVFAEVSDG